jgi:hypothetical protein
MRDVILSGEAVPYLVKHKIVPSAVKKGKK